MFITIRPFELAERGCVLCILPFKKLLFALYRRGMYVRILGSYSFLIQRQIIPLKSSLKGNCIYVSYVVLSPQLWEIYLQKQYYSRSMTYFSLQTYLRSQRGESALVPLCPLKTYLSYFYKNSEWLMTMQSISLLSWNLCKGSTAMNEFILKDNSNNRKTKISHKRGTWQRVVWQKGESLDPDRITTGVWK